MTLALELLLFHGSVIAISLSGVMAPGPLSAFTLARGRREPLAGFWIHLGHSIAEIPLILALMVGLAPFLRIPALRLTLFLLGGALLLWMGAGLIRSPFQREDSSLSIALRGSPVWAGIAFTVLNPYWYLWWLTVGTTFLAGAQAFGLGIVVVSTVTVHLACDLCWGTFLSWAAHRGGRVFSPRGWRFVELGCGGVLVLFAFWFFYKAVFGGGG